MTQIQAYKAMFFFVKQYYERKGKPEELALLLSDIQTLGYFYKDPQRDGDGSVLHTLDPASWYDWVKVVEEVLSIEDKN